MDGLPEEVASTLEEAAYRTTLSNQRTALVTKAAKDLSYSSDGGIFRITPELINFVSFWTERGNTTLVLRDVNDNPIMVSDLEAFLDAITERYANIMNDWYEAYQKIKVQRNARRVIEAA